MRYKVIRTCYWQRRLWEKGEMVELGENVPEHFKPLYNPAERLALNKNADDPSAKEPINEVPSDDKPSDEEPSNEASGENQDIMPSSLEDMNVGQLQKLARASGLEPPKNAKKQELISALRGE